MVEFPEALFDRLRAGEVVLCTGLSLSASSGMPAWAELLGSLCEKLGAERDQLWPLLDAQQYLTLLGYLKRKLGNETLAGLLREAYGNGAKLSAAHELLQHVPFHAVLTTGYDQLIERTLQRNGKTPRVYSYTDGAVLRLSEELDHFVVRAHGALDQPDKLVVSRLDFKRLVGPNQPYRAFVEDLYRTRTLLFLGFRPTDPDFQLLIDRLMAGFRDAVADHYAILPNVSTPEAEELYANHRIRVISYDEGDDAVAGLAAVLKVFHESWQAKGGRAEEVRDPIQWLTRQLGALELRIDVVSGEGISMPPARLDRIRETAERIDRDQLDAPTLCRLGNLYLHDLQLEQATNCYQAALTKAPELPEAHLNMHHAKAEARDFAQALEHLRRATELDDSLRVVPKRYELQAVIGRGTSGTVYQARDTRDNRDVTVKVLRVSYVREHVSPERWLEETRGLTRLTHQHIAKIHEAVIEEGRCILVSESLSGQNLRRVVTEQGPLDPERATAVMGQIAEALQYAHEQGVLHLDLIPSNIFLRDDGGATLMDFRSGRAERGRRLTFKKGSEGFQAPELTAGAGADARADVYSLGAVLYFAVTGRIPVGSFPRLAEVAPVARRFESLVTRAMRALPDERPQSVAEFAKILAGSAEAVAIPEDPDDLQGWLAVIAYQPDHPKALTALERLEADYRAAKDWENLVAMLLGRVELESSRQRRLEMLREVARVFELEVGDLSKAFAALQAAFREDLSNVEVRQDLERLAGATGMWNELLQEYSTLVQTVRDPKVACDWWVRMGHLYSAELGHDDYAAAAFGHALSLDANRRDALAELAEVVRRKGDVKEYARLVDRQVQLEGNAQKKIDLLRELAHAYRELDDRAQVTECFRQVLEIAPTNRAALTALEEIYRKTERWEDLAQMLRGAIGNAEDPAAQVPHRRALADLLSGPLKDPEAAIGQYEQILAVEPDDVSALRGLERLYGETGRNDRYLEILDQRIASAESEPEKVALYRRLANEWERQSGGMRKAAEYLERAAELGGPTEDVLRSLIRLYWELKEHDKLVDAYEQQVLLVERTEERAGLYAALAKVYEENLANPDRAVDALSRLLTIDEENKIALSGLARLYRAAGNWAQAVEMLERLAAREEVDQQVECLYEIGLLRLEQLNQPEEAQAALTKALEIKDDHAPSLVALGELNLKLRNFGRAARLLREAARHSANELERIERFYRAGVVYQDDLADDDKAVEVFEQVIEIDPEHVAAGERLAALYEKRQEAEKARPLLEMLVRKAETKQPLLEQHLRLGDAYLAADQQDKAIESFREAYAIDPTSHQALRKLADLLHSRGEVQEAAKLYHSLLVHRRDSLEKNEIVGVFFRLGEIKSAQGEHTKARNMLEKALEVDPNNTEVLDRLVQLYEDKGDHEAVLRARKKQLAGVEDEETKARLLEEIGDLLGQQLKRGKEAVSFYEQAVAVRSDRRVLNKLLDTFIGQQRWAEATKVLTKLEALETDPEHRYRLHYTSALIMRDHLNRPRDAARHLDLALEADPTNMKAFGALRTLLTQQRNFEVLVKAYRRMLKRLPAETPVVEQVRLWHELGQICQDEIKDARGAIVAFEVAAKLDPSDVVRQENLARLYASAGPDAFDKAVAVNQRLLTHNPMRLEAYRELRRLYTAQGQPDKAWCVTAVLCLLKQATADEKTLCEKHRPPKLRRMTRKLTDELWRSHVYHPRQDAGLTEVFGVVAPVVAPMAVRPRKSYGLREGEQLDPTDDSRPYAAAYDYVSQVLDRQVDEMHLRADLDEDLSLFLAGETGEQAKTLLWVHPSMVDPARQERELVFSFTHKLALLRRDLMLAFVTPSPNVLRAVVLACYKLVDPSARISGDVEDIDRLVEVFNTDLRPGEVEALSQRVDALRRATSEEQMTEWMTGVSLSRARAALLVCDDLETAAKMVADEPSPVGIVDPRQRVAQLIAYAVSEEYFKLRELLGLQIAY